MLPNGLMASLRACLQREIQASGQLLDALRREHHALTGNDHALLNQAVAQKSELVTVMEACGRERNGLLRGAGCGIDRAAVEQLLNRDDPQRQAGIQRDWARLLELGAQCQRQNMINGIIIQAGQQQTRQALAILRGQPAAAAVEYGPERSRHPAASAHPIAKA
jgi:flagellar biosynthesis/type III secretory pathway chaperone